MTQSELLDLQKQISEDPASKNPKGDICIYTPKAQKKLREIAEWIQFNLAQEKKAKGLSSPISEYGYSGRKQNRR